jgi:arylsulfatase A-like enzyme
MHQKWYQAYEETVHVPAVFLQPKLFPAGQHRQTLTSHIDLVPTLMGLAGIDHESAATQLEKTHTEVRRLVGRDLSQWLLNGAPDGEIDDPLYFHTTDDVSEGLNQFGVRGNEYEAVAEPNDIDAVITNIDGTLWKYARYTDYTGASSEVDYELYNLTENPIETLNLANDKHAGGQVNAIRDRLDKLLDEQIEQKALKPKGGAPAR